MTPLRICALAACLFLLSACGQKVEPLPKEEFYALLGTAACSAGTAAVSGGVPTPEQFERIFEQRFAAVISSAGVENLVWQASKKAYAPKEEWEKLLRFHITWCITGMNMLR